MNSQREIKKTFPFTIASKRVKYLGINLNKNYKTLMTDIEENTNKWKDTLCSRLEEPILLKCPYYPKQFTDSMQSLPKFQWHFSQK